MKNFEQVRESLLDMLEDIDERLIKITNDTVVDNGSITKDFEDSTTNKISVLNEISNIKRSISQIDSGT